MSKYLINFTRYRSEALFTTDDSGRVVSFSISYGELPRESVQYLIDHFPLTENLIQKYGEIQNVKVSKVEEDLTFDNFWKVYNYRVGNKKRAERLWERLKDDQKAKAITYLKTYESFLIMNAGLAKLYPETYLNQERWNN